MSLSRKTKYSGRLNPTWIYYKRLDKFMSYPTRYSRRFDADPDYQEDSDAGARTEEDAGPMPGPSGVPAGQEWPCEVDSTLPLPGQDIHSYRMELLGIVSHQLEVQKQSLAVQERVIALMTSILYASGSAPVTKTESGV